MTVLLRIVCVWVAIFYMTGLRAVNDSLPPLVYADLPSVLAGKMNVAALKGDTVSLFYATVTGFRDVEQVIDSSGGFRFEVYIGHSSEVRLGFASRPGERISVFLVPGRESIMTVESRGSRLHYSYTGPLSRVNDDFANTIVFAPLFPEALRVGEVPMVKDIVTFRNYLTGKHNTLQQAIRKNEALSPATRQLLLMQRQIELYALLKDAYYYLVQAEVLAVNEPLSTELPETYFLSIAPEVPLGDSLYLYCLEYTYLLDQLRALKPLYVDSQLQEQMYHKAWISERDYLLLQRLNDLTGMTPISSFAAEEQQRLYDCIRLQERYAAQLEERYWQSLFGAELRGVQEYWEALDLAEKVRAFVPLTESDKSKVMQWQTPFIRREVFVYDSTMWVKKMRGLQKEPVRKDNEGQILTEDFFYSLYAPYKGAPVLLFFWETWHEASCAALTALQPVKERLARQGIRMLSVASQYSRQAEWEKAVTEYPGLHVRISGAQMRRLRNEYAVDSFPLYYLIDAQGVIVRRMSGMPVRRIEEALSSLLAQ